MNNTFMAPMPQSQQVTKVRERSVVDTLQQEQINMTQKVSTEKGTVGQKEE